MVAVIGRHVELKRSGRTWKGCCPFHGENTPSFHVYVEDKHFKCYGCGEYGDVFKFLQKLQGKEFPDVVRELAAEAGVEIPVAVEESAEVQVGDGDDHGPVERRGEPPQPHLVVRDHRRPRTLPERHDRVRPKRADIFRFLFEFVARPDANRREVELLIDQRLPSVRVGGEHVDREPVAQGAERLRHAGDQLPVDGEGPVHIRDQMLQPQQPAPGNIDLDHVSIIQGYTGWGRARSSFGMVSPRPPAGG